MKRTRDDEGAVAILVAILSIVLIGFAAFAVDFGNAYAVKRQLSVAADATALAVAKEVSDKYLGYGKGCYAPDFTGAAGTQLKNLADKVNRENDLSAKSTVESVTVTCTDHGVEVRVTNKRTVPTFLGGVLGVANTSPAGAATALVSVPVAYTGLRPVAACANVVTPALSTMTQFAVYLKNATAACTGGAPGNWGWTNFGFQGTNGPVLTQSDNCKKNTWQGMGDDKCTEDWIKDGFGGPVTIPNLVAVDGGVGGNSGNPSNLVPYLATLVTDGTVVQLPVATAIVGGGSGAVLNTTGVVTVIICAVHPGGNSAPVTSTRSECTGPGRTVVPPPPGDGVWYTLKNNEVGLWVTPIQYASSGVFGGSSCRVGDTACDFGTHTVSLWK